MRDIARSPSQTAEWLTCPIKRTLNYRMGIKARRLTKGDIAAIGGRGFAKAMEVYHKKEGDPVEAGLNEVIEAKRLIEDRSRIVSDWDVAYYDSIGGRVEHAVRRYIADDPLIDTRIEDVELVLPNHGYARIDLGIRDLSGSLAVLDYKFKLRLDAKYYDKTVNEYRNSWQQFHYAWAYGEYKGEPVSTYYICLVVAEPKYSAKIHEYPIQPEAMEMWKESAHRIWTQMEHEDMGLAQPWQAAVHEDRYGPCPYQRACFTHNFDMHRMLQDDYVLQKDDD